MGKQLVRRRNGLADKIIYFGYRQHKRNLKVLAYNAQYVASYFGHPVWKVGRVGCGSCWQLRGKLETESRGTVPVIISIRRQSWWWCCALICRLTERLWTTH